jgi:cytochrome c oxidase assembly protein subunit 15
LDGWACRYACGMAELTASRARVFSIVAWATLAFNVLVILGGTIVRATGSGDGCGESWPKCGDQFIPPNPSIETAIEFSHRASSVMAGVGVLVLVVLAIRFFPKGSIVRRAAIAAGVILIVEALLGAALVLFGWVDADVSMGRMVVVPLHLTNTFLLLGSLALTAWWGSGMPPPRRSLGGSTGAWLMAGAAVLIVLGATGALNALADTIFPANSVAGDLSEKFGPTAPALSRLCIVHPVVAVVGGLLVAWIATSHARAGSLRSQRAASFVTIVVLSQMFVGIANIFFLTPLALQVMHLMVADVLWIGFVLFGASLLGDEVATADRPKVTA